MGSSRQLLLGTGVFIGGGILLLSLVKQMDAPQEADIDNAIKIEQVSSAVKTDQEPLTADLETEERILAQKRLEREKKMAQLDQKTREFLSEQEKAEALAMQKARLENEQYRSGAAEPVVDEMPKSEETSKAATPVTRPVVTARATPEANTQQMQARNEEAQATVSKPEPKPRAEVASSKAPSSTQKHTVQRGEGLIKLSRQYNVPVEAISQANKLSKNATIRVGQEITIPSQSQIDRLVRDYNASNSSQSKPQQTKAVTTSSSAPTSQQQYQVKAGDGLIKLSRQYNVPVEALAAANNMSTNSSLRVGQNITIPSRKQVQRLQREAEQKKAAEQSKREAQQRLVEARRRAASGEAKGTFGVQVALADNQQKADAIVKELRAAGYSASTSNTSKGVRVIVGPEKGKDKNATIRVGQEITIPSQSQIDRLVRDYNASNSSQSKPQQTKAVTTSSSAPTSQQQYQVKAGDGLIKLSRQYNVPVEALAAANNMSTNSSLRVGQNITIPSRKQVQRLQREAEQKKAAEQSKREAQQRLVEARRRAASGEAKGTFGVQVALADNQQKADAIVKELRAAGYSASTSNTSKGVRVIVGPEKGKEAALALKDKINADPKTNVNNAWVLYWR